MKGKNRTQMIESKRLRKSAPGYVSPYGRKVMDRHAELLIEQQPPKRTRKAKVTA